jgi:hypothetical protein
LSTGHPSSGPWTTIAITAAAQAAVNSRIITIRRI